jgi:hypothetical protein
MMTSIFDPISSNIPLKLIEKIWNGEFVELNLMLKSNQILLNELSTVGNLAVKEGILSVVHKKSSPIRNIHVWTSAFMVYASVMLRFNSTNSPFHIFSISLSGMLDEMGSNMLVIISGGCGSKNCEFKFTFDCSIAISPV